MPAGRTMAPPASPPVDDGDGADVVELRAIVTSLVSTISLHTSLPCGHRKKDPVNN